MKLEDKYKKLDEITHIKMRSGMYLGSIEPETKKLYIPFYNNEDKTTKMKYMDMHYNPSFLKLFDEIITNSSDESRRKGSKLNEIRVNVDVKNNTITISDNGGIPIKLHKEYNQFIPEMIFTNLRAGSNFNDEIEDNVAGSHGLGSKLVVIFSKEFNIETCDGSKLFEMNIYDNMSDIQTPYIQDVDSKLRKLYNLKSKEGFTKITYKPDLELLKMDKISDDNIKMLELRTYEIAATNPHLNVYYNDTLIDVNTFKDYIMLFLNSNKTSSKLDINDRLIYIEQEGWRVGIAYNDFETQHTSFVNGISTSDGGTHVDYITNMVVDSVRTKLEKDTKQEIRPMYIKNNMHFFIDCDINNPKFTSQTKDKVINQPSTYNYKFELSDANVKKLLSSAIFKRIVEWANRKKELDAIKEVEDKIKKVKVKGFHDIKKYRPATSTNRSKCKLFLAEGESASKPLKASSNPQYDGIFELKGKPENCYEKKLGDVISEEFLNLSRVLNLSITNPDYSKMRYDKIVIACDADCLVEGTKVTTETGIKNIEDINPFEKVKTHNGHYKSVISVTESIKKESVILETKYGDIESSKGHKHFVKRDGVVLEVYANDILITDKLLKKIN